MTITQIECFSNIEKAFKDFLEKKQWACIDIDGKLVFPNTSKDICDGRTGKTYSDVLQHHQKKIHHYTTLQYGRHDKILTIILRDVRNPDTGKITPKAQDIIKRIGSYTEIAINQKDIHIYAKGHRSYSYTDNENKTISIYCYRDFFDPKQKNIPLTGNVLGDFCVLNTAKTDDIDSLIKKDTSEFYLPEPFREYIDKKIWLASDENKKPISPITGHGKGWSLPKSCGTFADLKKHIESNPSHNAAIALSKECELVAFDLDNAIDSNEQVFPWAQAIIDRLSGAYVEKSSSGKGFHIFAKGSKPGASTVKAYPDGGKLEIYDSKKAMRLTGAQYKPCDQLIDLTPVIEDIYHALFPEKEQLQEGTYSFKKSPPMSDEEVIILCRKAKNSDKFKKLFDDGNMSEYGNDSSSAEMALCSLVAFYTQDPLQLDRLVRKSKLFETAKKCREEKGSKTNDKWERQDYRERTIKKALEGIKETYQAESNQSNKEAQESTWENPSGIDENDNLDIEFPVDELPHVLKNAVEEVSRDSRVDPALVSLPGLGITSLVIGKKAIVVEKPGLKHHCSLLLIGVASSGERKSSCFDSMLDGVKAEIENEMEDYNKAKASVRAHNELITESVSSIKKALKEKQITPQSAQQQIEELYANEKSPPPEPYNFGDDLTEQRLFQKIAEHSGAYGVFSSDGRGIIKKILGTKSGESGDSIYISAMWGDDLSRSRVGNPKEKIGGEDLRIRKPALTTVTFIQPDLWDELSKDSRMRESGFISRITLVIPISQMGTRLETADDPPLDSTKIQPFTEAILRLRKWKPEIPIEIHLDYQASAMRREFFNSIEKELGAGGSFEDVKDIATKATTMATRLALNIAMLEAATKSDFNGQVPSISKEQWLRAQSLEEYFLSQAVDSQRTHGKTGTIHVLQKVAAWLKKQAIQHSDGEQPLTFLASQIAKGNRGTKTTEIEEKIIPAFIGHQWLRLCGTVRGGKPKYELNPRILDEKI